MRGLIRTTLAAAALCVAASASAQPGGVPLPERECQRECLEGFVDRSRPRTVRRGKSVTPRKGDSKASHLNSFPSGHSAGAMAVACAFAAEYPEHRAAALAAGGAVSLAQVPTASHYPSDVAAGVAIGVTTESAVGLAWRAAARLWRRWTG